ncbi:MAG: DsbA family protein [Variovorax sp.]
MNKTLHYLFDPLCGWCYGATPAVSQVLETPGIVVKMLPTGLFSGEGARAMDDAFADFAWSNDQRIERLTRQSFTQRYRERVLGDRHQLFDSGPATLALTAVSRTDPARELETLKAIQRARYVDGRDVTSLAALASLLEGLGLTQATAKVAHPDADLLSANAVRIRQAQALMREFSARGVPTLIAEGGAKRWMLDPGAAYSNPRALVRMLDIPANLL